MKTFIAAHYDISKIITIEDVFSVNIRTNFTYRATTRTLSNASVSLSLSEVVADRAEKPEPKVDDREDRADVEALALLSEDKCKQSVIFPHKFYCL